MTQCTRCAHFVQLMDDTGDCSEGLPMCLAVGQVLEDDSESIQTVAELTLFALAGLDSCPFWLAEGTSDGMTEARRLREARRITELEAALEAAQRRISELEKQVLGLANKTP
ncbi:MAG: hypothetical protein U0X20_23635 [Caldilineaceae bacterium]